MADRREGYQARTIQRLADWLKATYWKALYNPATGWIADWRSEDGGFAQNPIFVTCNGIRRQVAGSTIIFGPGDSITLTLYVYHEFYAIDGHGLIGEVSSVNDDDSDNQFIESLPRHPEIVEDEPPYRLLCNEYLMVGARSASGG
jgi:D-lyxose ketol-isomerase